jgi:hypothetical protein
MQGESARLPPQRRHVRRVRLEDLSIRGLRGDALALRLEQRAAQHADAAAAGELCGQPLEALVREREEAAGCCGQRNVLVQLPVCTGVCCCRRCYCTTQR